MGRSSKSHDPNGALPVASEKRLKASANQARYVKAELSRVGTYMISLGHLVEGPFDDDAFQSAIQKLLLRHEALRTRFEIFSGDVIAVVGNDSIYQYRACRTEDRSLSTFRNWALPLVFSDVDPRVPGALIRFLVADMGTSWRFTIAAHHAITDGVSRNLMNKELLELYAGKALPQASSYYDFVSFDAAGDRVLADVGDRVNALPRPVRVIGDGNGISSGHYIEHSFGALNPQITSLAKSLGTSKFGFLTAIYALGLRGFSGEDEVSSFFQSAGRRSLAAPDTVVGSFSNTLPLDLSVDLDKSFATFASEVLTQAKAVLALENGALLEAVIDAHKAPSVSINMFPSEVPISEASLSVGPREFLDRRTEFDLNMVWSEECDALTVRAFYSSAHISKTRARLFVDFQARLLEAALEDPHLACRNLIHAARLGFEAVELRKSINPGPVHRLHRAFFECASQTPDATAIKTSSESITYGALAKTARSFARGLRSAGIGEGDRVAILAQRHPLSVAAMLGVSASGASFALIDATYPTARIKMMLETLDTQYILEAGAKIPLDLASATTCILPALEDPSDADCFNGEPRNEAYHLFTSGTTGRPKLTTHPDQTLQRFISWQRQTLDSLDQIDTVMMTGLAHDPTLRVVFLPLSYGGSITIPTPCEMADPQTLRKLIKSADSNIVCLGPTTARLLTTGMPNGEDFQNLKAIFWGGERLPCETVSRWQHLAENARQFNVFGATETPQAFLIHEIDSNKELGREIPLGRPMPWNGARLVDVDGRPVSIGEVGEIVADLADPVGGSYRRIADDAGATDCVHFTGDLGYQMPNGNIHFTGRSDDQIKINGFRVRLVEIDTAAEAIAGVERACTIATDHGLSLFVLSEANEIAECAIRTELGKRLPSYMHPAQIFVLVDLPYTSNGKIDRAALREIALNPPARTKDKTRYEAPKGRTEMDIAGVFARHSGRPEIDRRDTLSDLGTDSLSSIEARFELENLGMNLPVGWQWRSLTEIAALNSLTMEVRTTRWSILGLRRTEMSVVLRCLAIVSIVAFHTGYRVTSGASIVLFVLAGYSFAQLQLPAILIDGHPRRVWALMAKLLIPLVPMSLVYLGFNIYLDIDTHASSLLFFRNLTEIIGAVFQPGGKPVRGLTWLWFLHAYLQIFLIFGLLLSSSAIRRVLSADIWRGLVVFFLITEGISLLAIFGVSLFHGDARDAGDLLHRTPVALIPFLAIGGVAATARTIKRLAISFFMIVVHVGVAVQFYAEHDELWWVLALGLCAVFPFVTLPKIVSKLVIAIAAYSLMIYLTHHAVFLVTYKIPDGGEAARALSIVAQLCFGVYFGLLMRPAFDWLGVNKLTGSSLAPAARM